MTCPTIDNHAFTFVFVSFLLIVTNASTQTTLTRLQCFKPSCNEASWPYLVDYTHDVTWTYALVCSIISNTCWLHSIFIFVVKGQPGEAGLPGDQGKEGPAGPMVSRRKGKAEYLQNQDAVKRYDGNARNEWPYTLKGHHLKRAKKNQIPALFSLATQQ